MPEPNTSPPVDRPAPLALMAWLAYPEYRQRHIFTARLRLLIFVVFWCLYVFVFAKEGFHHIPVLLVALGAFLVTGFCYYNILRQRWLIPSFALELLADQVGLTLIVYLTGGADSEYYFVYVVYCLMAGLFYNSSVALLTAILSLATYCTFLIGITGGWWQPLETALESVMDSEHRAMHHLHHPHPAWGHPEWGHPPLLAGLLCLAVYAVRIAQRFTQLRERVLEVRNRELQALQQISASVRRVASLPEVIDQVVGGILAGFNFALCFVMLVDRTRQKIACHPPSRHPAVARAEALLGVALRDLHLPFGTKENPVFHQLAHKQVAFRNSVEELMMGVQPPVAPEAIRAVQEALKVRKILAVPLVAEGEIIGALVGFSSEPFVNEGLVAALEPFANQAALVLQTTLLIDELKAKNAQLAEASRVKSEFLATMSHELRTPLTAIIGFSELLLEGVMGELSSEQQEGLREVLNNGANLLSLINNLLDLAKMESGRFTLVYEKFDLRALCDRTIRTLGSLITRKRLQFDSSYLEGLPPIEADERRIQQVVLNLLGNAIKFTPEGGRIRLEVGFYPLLEAMPDSRWRDHLEDRRPYGAGFFIVRVADTGIGIPKAYLRSIFDMFRQVDSSVTRSYEGTGLGLALTKQLVELHQGIIWAESEEGEGTTFTCLLPPAVPAIQKEGPEQPEPLAAPPVIHPIRVPV
ncbi:MAG: GAF domain-containing sensor histidine kinase [Deltaproteobacteria bacterium]|nr:GAF domain-containing sensor histidine kinase [Deltaproteobacteria bacterium]